MVFQKKYVIPLLLALELLFFGAYYFFAPYGIKRITKLRQENCNLNQSILLLRKDIATLTEKIDTITKYPYYKEKIAREQLQMMSPGDHVFYIT